MATSKDDDKKIFDVSKPGKSAPSASSRPVIIGHKNMLKDPMVKEDSVSELDGDKEGKTLLPPDDKPSGEPILPPAANENEDEPTTAPTVSRIKILPISDSKKSKSAKESKDKEEGLTKMEEGESITVTKKLTTDEPGKVEDSIGDDLSAEPEESTEPEEAKPEQTEEKEAKESKAEDTELKESDKEEADSKPDAEETEPDEKSEDKTEGQDESSESAEVATVAASAQTDTDKKAEKETKELAAKESAVNKLVEEKKYFVPIGEKKRRRANLNGFLLLLLFLIFAAAAVYLLIDAGIIKANINLPYHLFKQDTAANSNSITSVSTTPITTTPPKNTTTSTTLTIKEWNVKIPLKENHTISYILKNDSATFTTGELKKLCDAGKQDGVTVYRGKATDTYTASETGEASNYKSVYDARKNDLESYKSYAHYIKPFILGNYYYLPPSFGYATCTSNSSNDVKIEAELKYLRESIEAMKVVSS